MKTKKSAAWVEGYQEAVAAESTDIDITLHFFSDNYTVEIRGASRQTNLHVNYCVPQHRIKEALGDMVEDFNRQEIEKYQEDKFQEKNACKKGWSAKLLSRRRMA
jgi:hypothetical protein